MPQRDIIVIGGSAGAIQPVRTIVESLPSSFPASVLVVVHVSADYESRLDEQLARNSHLPVMQAVDMDGLRRGHVYIARPDHHLTVEAGRVRVLRGPKENRHRPAIDALFRTAARVYRSRVIGIILSGQNDDGSAGLYAVKQRGGVAIVQDPAEAAFPEMPRRALTYATPHYVLRTRDIASNLINLVQIDQDEILMPRRKLRKKSNGPIVEGGENDKNLHASYFDEGEGTPSVFACPECHGVLWELKDGDLVQFRCRVGHTYGSESLSKELSQASEEALWAAMRALEEKAAMQRRIADGMGSDNRTVGRLHDQSAADDANAQLIRDMIFARDAQLEREVSKKKKAA